MAYNYKLKVDKLQDVTEALFVKAVLYCMDCGINYIAPLGCSGDDIVIYGEMENEGTKNWNRKSLVTFRNYCGTPEMLITDVGGNFLFNGCFDNCLGIKKQINLYYMIFEIVKDKIDKTNDKTKFIDNIKENAKLSEGFDILNMIYEYCNRKDNNEIIQN